MSSKVDNAIARPTEPTTASNTESEQPQASISPLTSTPSSSDEHERERKRAAREASLKQLVKTKRRKAGRRETTESEDEMEEWAKEEADKEQKKADEAERHAKRFPHSVSAAQLSTLEPNSKGKFGTRQFRERESSTVWAERTDRGRLSRQNNSASASFARQPPNSHSTNLASGRQAAFTRSTNASSRHLAATTNSNSAPSAHRSNRTAHPANSPSGRQASTTKHSRPPSGRLAPTTQASQLPRAVTSQPPPTIAANPRRSTISNSPTRAPVHLWPVVHVGTNLTPAVNAAVTRNSVPTMTATAAAHTASTTTGNVSTSANKNTKRSREIEDDEHESDTGVRKKLRLGNIKGDANEKQLPASLTSPTTIAADPTLHLSSCIDPVCTITGKEKLASAVSPDGIGSPVAAVPHPSVDPRSSVEIPKESLDDGLDSTNVAAPRPIAKKKMSLSEYYSRREKNTKDPIALTEQAASAAPVPAIDTTLATTADAPTPAKQNGKRSRDTKSEEGESVDGFTKKRRTEHIREDIHTANGESVQPRVEGEPVAEAKEESEVRGIKEIENTDKAATAQRPMLFAIPNKGPKVFREPVPAFQESSSRVPTSQPPRPLRHQRSNTDHVSFINGSASANRHSHPQHSKYKNIDSYVPDYAGAKRRREDDDCFQIRKKPRGDYYRPYEDQTSDHYTPRASYDNDSSRNRNKKHNERSAQPHHNSRNQHPPSRNGSRTPMKSITNTHPPVNNYQPSVPLSTSRGPDSA